MPVDPDVDVDFDFDFDDFAFSTGVGGTEFMRLTRLGFPCSGVKNPGGEVGTDVGVSVARFGVEGLDFGCCSRFRT